MQPAMVPGGSAPGAATRAAPPSRVGRDPTPRPGGAPPATPVGQRRPSPDADAAGLTPIAKRARDVPSGVTGVAGPPMSAEDMNSFVHALHNKLEAMMPWAQTVNDAITDHASRIDIQHGEQVVITAEVAHATNRCATDEADSRQIMSFVQANDDVLRAQDLVTKERIEEVCTKLGVEVDKLTTSQAGSYAELRELTRLVDAKLVNLETELLKLAAATSATQSGYTMPVVPSLVTGPLAAEAQAHMARDLAILKSDLAQAAQQQSANIGHVAGLMARVSEMRADIVTLQNVQPAPASEPTTERAQAPTGSVRPENGFMGGRDPWGTAIQPRQCHFDGEGGQIGGQGQGGQGGQTGGQQQQQQQAGMFGSGGVASFASLSRPTAFASAEQQRLQQQQQQQQQYQQTFAPAHSAQGFAPAQSAQGFGAQQFSVGTPPQPPFVAPRMPGDKPDNLKLDTKLALLDKHKYSDSAPETWHKNVRTYLVGLTLT